MARRGAGWGKRLPGSPPGIRWYLYGAAVREDVDPAAAAAAYEATPLYQDGRPTRARAPGGGSHHVKVSDNLGASFLEALAPVLPYVEWWGPLAEPPPWGQRAPNGQPWLVLTRFGFPGVPPRFGYWWGVRFDAAGALLGARGAQGARP